MIGWHPSYLLLFTYIELNIFSIWFSARPGWKGCSIRGGCLYLFFNCKNLPISDFFPYMVSIYFFNFVIKDVSEFLLEGDRWEFPRIFCYQKIPIWWIQKHPCAELDKEVWRGEHKCKSLTHPQITRRCSPGIPEAELEVFTLPHSDQGTSQVRTQTTSLVIILGVGRWCLSGLSTLKDPSLSWWRIGTCSKLQKLCSLGKPFFHSASH